MGKELYETSPVAKEYFEKANEILGFRITDIMFEGSDEQLRQTRVTQPAVFLHSVITAIAQGEEFCPDMVAGHSLGEFSALTAAGALTFEDGLKLVYKRALAMQNACEMQQSTMAAILGLEDEIVEKICKEISDQGETVLAANYNCPGQLVIGGEKAAVTRAGELAMAAGARRLMPLRVSGPFHTPLMQPAADALAARFETQAFGEMRFPVLFNCLGHEKGDETIPSLLVRQVRESVYMEDTIRRLMELGVDTVIEIGPGRALSGFVAKTAGNAISCYAIEDAASLEAAVSAVLE